MSRHKAHGTWYTERMAHGTQAARHTEHVAHGLNDPGWDEAFLPWHARLQLADADLSVRRLATLGVFDYLI